MCALFKCDIKTPAAFATQLPVYFTMVQLYPGQGLHTNSALPWRAGDPKTHQDKARGTTGLSRPLLNKIDMLGEGTPSNLI